MNTHQKKTIFYSLLLFGLVIFVIGAFHRFGESFTGNSIPISDEKITSNGREDCKDESYTDQDVTMYAVFGSNTPNGESYRSYDYAYQLPMAALAWERIGFKSIVLIVGSRCEWDNEPALRHVLTALEARQSVTVIFVSAPLEQRPLLSQTGRIFAANLPEFPGKPYDYVVTSDADLWPLHREHFIHQPGKNVVLVHSLCCGFFDWKGKTYRMYPMGNIGATANTWRQILNEQQKTMTSDSPGIIKYMQEEFGALVNQKVVVAEQTWYLDQKLVSIRIAQWMQRHGNETVHVVSDDGWTRVDRARWDAAVLNQTSFEKRYDAHLPVFTFRPDQWSKVLPLVKLMYGENSTLTNYCEDYTKGFLSKVKNYFPQS